MKTGKMCHENYIKRITDEKVEKYLSLFGAVEISGTMWCGKTWSALAQSESVIFMDKDSNRQLVSADTSYALTGEKPHLIDEWQLVPGIWDTIRHAVDTSGGKKGQWILTGSSAPDKSKVNHSGAGRIGRVHMRPMSLQESGDSTGAVSLEGLFNGEFTPCEAPTDISELAYLICRGGWPQMRESTSEDSQMILKSYLNNVFDISIPRLGGNSVLARRLALSLARNLCQSVKLSVLAKDVYSRKDSSASEDMEKRNVSSQLDIIKKIYLVEEVTGWVPPTRSPERMRTKAKNYFADQSIPVALLGLSENSVMKDYQTFGLLFENMCMRDLAVYASAVHDAKPDPLYYYRDDSNLEADAIIEKNDGRYAVIEIKMNPSKVDDAAANINRLKQKIVSNPMAENESPSFCAIITGTGDRAYQRPDGIYVIPIRVLGK